MPGRPGHAGPAPRTQTRGEFSVCPAGEPAHQQAAVPEGGRRRGTGLPQARACSCMAGPACFWKSQGRLGGGWGEKQVPEDRDPSWRVEVLGGSPGEM